MKWMKNLREDRSGFTLIEMLAVLVIIAILAAVAIPTMTGFIQDAKLKSHTSQARAVYVAAQAAAIGMEGSEMDSQPYGGVVHSSRDDSAYIDYVKELLAADAEEGSTFTITLNENKVERVEYTPAGGKKITIVGGDSVTYEED